jgi:hypothetical protein
MPCPKAVAYSKSATVQFWPAEHDCIHHAQCRYQANASNAASLPTPAALTARTTALWLSPAKAGEYTPHATRGVWWRLQRISLITFFPAWRCASGCC